MTSVKLHRRQFVILNAASVLGGFSMGQNKSNASSGEPNTNDSVSMQQDADIPPNDSEQASLPVRGVPTLGGRQFWGDLSYLNGWKIQRNVFTGHCRLLNPAEYRYASGSPEHCQSVLNLVKQQQRLKPDAGKAVILLHGIGRSSHCFAKMKVSLLQDGLTVVPFEYPSTRISLQQSAEYLQSVIESLGSISSIDFVAHSLGGLVVRTLLKDFSDPRLHSLVMLGTPNYGAELADMLHRTKLFSLVFGPAGQQLVTGGSATIGQLPVPSIPFAVVAGGKGTAEGYNPLLPGDDDGTVTVNSTRLSGAVDFLQVPRIHTFLTADPEVIAAVCCFLREGRFNPAKPAQPIPGEPAA